ncbi:hypothetical protein CDCA_CDCA12G3526 [Cyanidium caldarium]|uniref:Ribosomal protein L46 N-terminal domain-containing protein n=1 Tax=Cyanidium caldarium TaxID=2771 RepID=A0AAV9IZE7_CYACA|nr:hypothetical protein CDCA_CDCA12G3526 [Cyanidium caldarium]
MLARLGHRLRCGVNVRPFLDRVQDTHVGHARWRQCQRFLAAAAEPRPSTTADRRTAESGLPFRMVAATVLERLPIIIPEPKPEEAAFEALSVRLANAQARELPPEFFNVGKGAEEHGAPAASPPRDGSGGAAVGQPNDGTASGMPLGAQTGKKPFELAPRITEADLADDRRSLRRKLDQRLYLIVQRQLGDARSIWQFPQRNIEVTAAASSPSTGDDAPAPDLVPFRHFAERALDSVLEIETEDTGDDDDPFEAHFLGNAPLAHFKHIYSEAFQKQHGVQGIKIFFYRAVLIFGSIRGVRKSAADDYAWVTANELEQYLAPDYYRCIRELVW